MNEEKFTGKADVYDKYRPSYPSELIDWLYEKTHAETVADIGAGTGIFTKCLTVKPWTVAAVEPNADMLEKLRANLSGIEIINAPAENTGIEAGSIDLVTAAQAFHWFDREKFRTECQRILAPNGRLALIWNNHGKNDFRLERDRIFMKYCGMCNSVAGKPEEGDSVLRSGYFSEMEYNYIEYSIFMEEERFVGYSLSHSYALKEGDAGYEDFVRELHNAFADHQENGKVNMPFWAECYLGKFELR